MEVFKIAGVQVKTPCLPLTFGRFNITKSKRAASGKMKMEIIRKNVRRIDATWKMIEDTELQRILDLIDANEPIFEVEYPDVGGQVTKRFYRGDISYSMWFTKNGIRYWEEVTIPFIEE